MSNEELFLSNNSRYLEKIKKSKSGALIFAVSTRLRKKYNSYINAQSVKEKSFQCAEVLDAYQESWLWKIKTWIAVVIDDKRVRVQQRGHKKIVIDYSNKRTKDFYSIMVIIKNEARYMREFVLFYQATGADRIYVYDNDSTDNLLAVLEPFIKSGFVIYKFIHGTKVQEYAYRDAVRKTRHRTKWLALVDADEFLFSPKGNMPRQLQEYEKYPAVGANWVIYGPNGHIKRPDGLIMDNYTETFADRDIFGNRHIKSIVQPKRVFTVRHTHFAFYKGKAYAVNEQGNKISNFCAYVETAGRAFTESHSEDVFRINHYYTKSHEDIVEKCERGYADGANNRAFDDILELFNTLMTDDYSIKPYADIVREEYNKY